MARATVDRDVSHAAPPTVRSSLLRHALERCVEPRRSRAPCGEVATVTRRPVARRESSLGLDAPAARVPALSVALHAPAAPLRTRTASTRRPSGATRRIAPPRQATCAQHRSTPGPRGQLAARVERGGLKGSYDAACVVSTRRRMPSCHDTVEWKPRSFSRVTSSGKRRDRVLVGLHHRLLADEVADQRAPVFDGHVLVATPVHDVAGTDAAASR